jgi:hypothetical protein
MTARALRAALAIAVLLACTPGAAAAASPPPNSVSQWGEIAQKTVVSSGALQNEGLVYMAYVSAAVYDAATSIQGGYEPYGGRIPAPRGASTDAAVTEAAYRTLVNYFPAPRAAGAPDLDALHSQALAEIPSGPAKDDGIAVGATAAARVIALRTGDGRVTPIGSRLQLALQPDSRARRLAPHSPRLRASPDSLGGDDAAVPTAQSRPVPTRTAARAAQPRLGAGDGGSQGLRWRQRKRPQRRAD